MIIYKSNKIIAPTLLVILITGLFNLCFFSSQVKASVLAIPEKVEVEDNCQPQAKVSHASAPVEKKIPVCCLDRDHYYEVIVVSDDQDGLSNLLSVPLYTDDRIILDNKFSYHNFSLFYPPPDLSAVTSVVRRE